MVIWDCCKLQTYGNTNDRDHIGCNNWIISRSICAGRQVIYSWFCNTCQTHSPAMLFLPLHFLLCTLKLVVNVVFLRQMPGLSPACLVALKEKSGCVIIAISDSPHPQWCLQWNDLEEEKYTHSGIKGVKGKFFFFC